ncbi:hypothetical protein [Sinorhizobium glycinis]|uniref:hypothetical protein n=1 Tax=Sinorhizobium glycinis TaxID=1472378 RepID=UPI001A7E04A1|nr:hypothetical protein [Sinorhizobium glycinis]
METLGWVERPRLKFGDSRVERDLDRDDRGFHFPRFHVEPDLDRDDRGPHFPRFHEPDLDRDDRSSDFPSFHVELDLDRDDRGPRFHVDGFPVDDIHAASAGSYLHHDADPLCI